MGEITNAQSYREKVYKESTVTVPSGHTFKIKILSPIDYLDGGMNDLPAPFLDFVVDPNEAKLKSLLTDKESAEKLSLFIEITVDRGIIEPKVLIKYDEKKKDECLFWGELSEADQLALINAITGNTTSKKKLKPFFKGTLAYIVDGIACRYKRLPSEIINLPLKDFNINLAIYYKSIINEQKQREKQPQSKVDINGNHLSWGDLNIMRKVKKIKRSKK